MKNLIISAAFLFSINLFSGIQDCIKSKMVELGAQNYKGDMETLSRLKSESTQACLNLKSGKVIVSERTAVFENAHFQKTQPEVMTQDRSFSSVSNNSLDRSKCIKAELLNLGAHQYKGNFEKISELKNEATARCMNLSSNNTVNSNRTAVTVLNNKFQRSTATTEENINSNVIKSNDEYIQPDSSNPHGLDYSQDTPQLNWEYQNQITEKEKQAVSRGIASLPNSNHSSRTFAKCVQDEMKNLGAQSFVGDAQKVYELKGQATKTCFK